MPEPRPFKDLVDAGAVARLGAAVAAAWPAFPAAAFVAEVSPGLAPLELKERVQHVADGLRARLPEPWPEALAVLVAALPPAVEGAEGVSGGFELWPVLTAVERHGLDHPAASLEALRAMTRRFSAEFAVRPYLDRHLSLTLHTLHRWASDADPHVRRLVSEGSRPRLPWGRRLPRLQADPSLGLGLLERLVDDPEPYVRRSVANHLGDIAKDHPDVAVETARRWVAEGGEQRAWIARHGLRALIKAGHPGALAALGFDPARLEVGAFVVTPEVLPVGGQVSFEVVLRSVDPEPRRIVVDYAVQFARPSGRPSRKVFKGTILALEPGATRAWTGRHRFRDVSIRAHHPGPHVVELLVQGEPVATATITLTPA